MKKALFPGSFDPFTNGHLATIQQGATLFDEITVGIMTNAHKVGLFTLPERKLLIEETLREFENVKVIEQSEGLTVNLAHDLGIHYLIRGIRNVKDYEYERDMAFFNKKLNESVETIFFFSPPELAHISSSMLKEIAKYGGDISYYVSEIVAEAVKKKYKMTGERT